MQFFITRPVFAMVLSVLITLAGVLALTQLPIAQYPDVVPPQVVVTATYPGADARTVSATVAAPIEQQVNGVEGMLCRPPTTASCGSRSRSSTAPTRTWRRCSSRTA
jgi:multidrug efflux pump